MDNCQTLLQLPEESESVSERKLNPELEYPSHLEEAAFLASRGRTNAAICEIVLAARLTPVSRRKVMLREAAQILSLLGETSLSKVAYQEALFIIGTCKHQHPDEIQGIVAAMNSLPSNTEELTLGQEKETDTITLNNIATMITDEPKNDFASALIRDYTWTMEFAERICRDRLLDATYNSRVEFVSDLFNVASKDMRVATLCKEIVRLPSLWHNVEIVAEESNSYRCGRQYGLPISESQFSSMYRGMVGSRRGDWRSRQSNFCFTVLFRTKTMYLQALRDYQGGRGIKARESFEDLIRTCLAFLEWVQSLECKHRAEFRGKQSLKMTLVTCGGAASTYSLALLLRSIDKYNVRKTVMECGDSLELVSRGLNMATEQGCASPHPLHLAELYMSQARVSELRAIMNASTVLYNDQSWLKLEDTSLENAARSYLLSLQKRSCDDPLVPLLYDRVIWSVFARGGLELNGFWKLRRMRDLAYMRSNQSLFSVEDGLALNEDFLLLREDVTSKFLDIVDRFYSTKDALERTVPYTSFALPKYAVPQCLFSDRDFGAHCPGSYVEFGKPSGGGILKDSSTSLTAQRHNRGFSKTFMRNLEPLYCEFSDEDRFYR